MPCLHPLALASMKILHVLDHSIPLQSGYTFRTRNILREQRALGWDTHQVTGPKQLNCAVEQEEIDGLLFYRTGPCATGPVQSLLPEPVRVIRQLEQRLDEVIAAVQPQVLHAHSPALDGVAALRAARRHRLPVVYECRAFWEDAAVDHGTSREGGLRYRLTRAMETWVFRHADAVTTICEGLRAEIAARGVPESRITVIPNAVDLNHFQRAPEQKQEATRLRQELGLGDHRVLGFLGSFYAYEGLDLAIESLQAINDPRVVLLLVGGGPQSEALRQQVKALGLEDRVRFTGRVAHEQVQHYYDLVDLLVYPRKSMRLTELVTPLKPLEAMAQHKLVLASDVGGHRELICDGETGWLFEAGSAQALARTAERVLALPEHEWQRVRNNGRQYVETERNWPLSVAKYASVYAAATADESIRGTA